MLKEIIHSKCVPEESSYIFSEYLREVIILKQSMLSIMFPQGSAVKIYLAVALYKIKKSFSPELEMASGETLN